jgi:TFIIF-interacting CTD phosphatase-like protein
MNVPIPRPLLILDLDETLIHGSETELHRPADFRVGPLHLYQRPFLASFLAAVTPVYELAIWSSASEDYVGGIGASLLRLGACWTFVWSRSRCVERMDPEMFETVFIKDLRKVERLGYDLNRILIVDDTHKKLARNYGNAIYVSPFEGSDTDNELPRLAAFLRYLHAEPNFRTIEKRGWRNRSFTPESPSATTQMPDNKPMNPSGGSGVS